MSDYDAGLFQNYCNVFYFVARVGRFAVIMLLPVFPLRKLYTEQILVLVRMQLRNHVDTQPVMRFQQFKRSVPGLANPGLSSRMRLCPVLCGPYVRKYRFYSRISRKRLHQLLTLKVGVRLTHCVEACFVACAKHIHTRAHLPGTRV